MSDLEDGVLQATPAQIAWVKDNRTDNEYSLANSLMVALIAKRLPGASGPVPTNLYDAIREHVAIRGATAAILTSSNALRS